MNTDIIQRAKLLVAMQQTQSDILNVIVPAWGQGLLLKCS
jgi:hypothetical protein